METQAVVLSSLRDVLDPETGASMLDLGVIRDVRFGDTQVTIVLNGAHELARHFADEAEAAARDAVPEGWSVEVALA